MGEVIPFSKQLNKPRYDAQAYDVEILVLAPQSQTVRVIANSEEEAVRLACDKFGDDVCIIPLSTAEVPGQGGQA